MYVDSRVIAARMEGTVMAKALAAEQVTTWHTKNKVILITLGVLVAVIAAVLSGCGGDKSAASGSASVSAMAQTKEEASQQASKDSDLPEEYTSALDTAQQYVDTVHMSRKGLYDQLTSDSGDKFSAKAATYALAHVKADYKANALKIARSYQKQMKMSPKEIRDQLVSDSGDKFTGAEADYAVSHLK